MKSIDILTSVPKSPDVAKVVARAGRYGEVQAQGQISGFSREMSQRNWSVNETPKTVTENKVDSESPGGGGSAYGSSTDEKRKGEESDKENLGSRHPVKGKVLDIKGA